MKISISPSFLIGVLLDTELHGGVSWGTLRATLLCHIPAWRGAVSVSATGQGCPSFSPHKLLKGPEVSGFLLFYCDRSGVGLFSFGGSLGFFMGCMQVPMHWKIDHLFKNNFRSACFILRLEPHMC